jgi:hypothetical protein
VKDPFLMQDLTADALVQLLHRYYPSGLLADEPEYRLSEEAQRLQRLLRDVMKDMQAWDAFIQRLHEQFTGCMIWDRTLPHEPCYICDVALPGVEMGGDRYDAITCQLSLLAPVYTLYAQHYLDTGPLRESWSRFPPFPPEYQAHGARLASLIESTFGFRRLSNEVLSTPLPDLVPQSGTLGLGKARLIDCLFTSHWP